MSPQKPPATAPSPAPHRTDEPDIGSGEKNPGQVETEKMIEQVPPTPAKPPQPASPQR